MGSEETPYPMQSPGKDLRIEVAGATLNVAVAGPRDAPPVLHWNGAMCALPMWEFVVERLCDRYRMVRFDVRGIGRSTVSGSESRFTLEQYAEDACVILDQLGIDRVNIWSMAWGTRLAIAFAARYPDRVDRVALFDASIGAADVKAQAEGHKRAVELQIASGIPAFARPDGWSAHDDVDTAQRATRAAGKFDLSAVVESLAMPVLVATGDQDPNLVSSREIASRVGGSQLVVMENVGHASVLQRPDLTSEVFDAFIGAS